MRHNSALLAGAWFGKYGSAIVDGGSPVGRGQRFERGGSGSASTSEVAGYSFVEASDQAALEVMPLPHVTSGGRPANALLRSAAGSEAVV